MGYLEAKNKIRRVATHLSRRIKGEPRIINCVADLLSSAYRNCG